jgi:hypothetical protein
VRIEREAFKSVSDEKLTGRQLFEKNKNAFEDLTLADDGEDIDISANKFEDNEEESKDPDEEPAFVYDRALYEDVEDAEEDIEFD